MTIKIVGTDTNMLRRVTCRNCLSILEYAPIDTKKRVEVDYTGGRDTVTFIKCPHCNKEVSVK